MSYKTSNAEGHVDFINTYDLEPMAQQVIPKAAFGYIASGAEDTFTLRENIRAFNHKLIVPHTLCNVENPSTEIEFAGEKLSSPIIMAPVAAHKLANEQGEVATARGVHEFGSLYTTSSYSTVDLPEITEALQGTPHWFQFYFSKDDGINRHIMEDVYKRQGLLDLRSADYRYHWFKWENNHNDDDWGSFNCCWATWSPIREYRLSC